MVKKLKFIDLFAGLGGIRLGFEQACSEKGIMTECVLTSEIKPYAIQTLKSNFTHKKILGDIFAIKNEDIPDFDFLLGGFPCQPFSFGGKRNGFADTRGTLFFEIERVLRSKNPIGFILENVEGLIKHDLENKDDKIGRTLKTILFKLENELKYSVAWKVLDSVDFSIPQSRKRVFIIGLKKGRASFNNFKPHKKVLKDILENGKPVLNSDFINKLLFHFSLKELVGKSIKDKRGGKNNIHSWDIGIKGEITNRQKIILNKLFKARRQKKWAKEIGIDWMDGMPLTLDQIRTFTPERTLFDSYNLKELLDELVDKGYLRYEHPKKIVRKNTASGIVSSREFDTTKEKGYNIVTGKLSFEINKILDPDDIAPTLVATDTSRLAVVDGVGLRRLTVREGLRLFGYPEWYKIPTKESEAFDLLGNTVVVPVVKYVAISLLDSLDKPSTISFTYNSISSEIPV